MSTLSPDDHWALPTDAEDFWAWLELPPERIALHHLGHILMSTRDLPPWAGIDTAWEVEPVVRAACVEAFCINVRLAAEFFARQPDRRDFRATDHLPTWVPPDNIRQDLGEAWTIASHHVVHLSRERTATTDAGEWAERYSNIPGDSVNLNGLAVSCYDALVAFTRDYESANGEYARQFRSMVRGLRPHWRGPDGEPIDPKEDPRDDLDSTRDEKRRLLEQTAPEWRGLKRIEVVAEVAGPQLRRFVSAGR